MEITIQINDKKYPLAKKEYVKAVYDKFADKRVAYSETQLPLFQLLVDYYQKDVHLTKGISSKDLGKELKKKEVGKKKDFITDDGLYARRALQRLRKALKNFFEEPFGDDVLIVKSVPLCKLNRSEKTKRKHTYVFLTEPRRTTVRKKYTGFEVQNLVDKIILDKTSLFVGRQEELERLDNFVSENSSGYLIVTAKAGFGKTSLLANWLATQKDKGHFIAYHFLTLIIV